MKFEEIERKDGTRYRSSYRRHGKQLKSPYFRRKTDAKSWKIQKLAESDREKALGRIIANEIPFAELSELWIISKEGRAPSSLKTYQDILRIHITPFFRDIKIKDIRTHDCNKLKKKVMDKGLSIERVNAVIKVLKGIFKFAVDNENLLFSPAKKVDNLRRPIRKLDYWKPGEVKQFLDANQADHYFPIYLTAVNTGLRKGELCGLLWDCVDFENGFITVRRNYSRLGLAETTKGGKSRQVPMNEATRDCLMALRNKSQSMKFVFTRPDGEPVDYEHLGHRIFLKAIKRAKVRRIKFHNLRVTFGCSFVSGGGSIFPLSKILGHCDVKITATIYAELSPDYLKSVSEFVNFSANKDLCETQELRVISN